MVYDYLSAPLSPWQDGSGEFTDVVIDSRIRLSRNLKNYIFPGKASDDELRAVFEEGRRIMPALQALGRGEYQYIDLESLSALEREMLAVKHIVSAAHIAKPQHRAVMARDDGAVAVMVNEADHFCIQAAAHGLALIKAWKEAAQADDALESRANFAFCDDFGYLTASPSVTGTGLVAGVTIHVPALVLMKRLSRVVQGITKFGFAVCGMYGERGEYIGNLFQITNQITLGVSEDEILDQLKHIVIQVVQEERQCRQMLWTHNSDTMHDKFCRACGILENSWLMGEKECISLLSDLRFGIDMSILQKDRLLYECLLTAETTAYLQAQAGKDLDEQNLERQRAAVLRRLIAGRGFCGNVRAGVSHEEVSKP